MSMRNYLSSETSRRVLTGLLLVARFGISRLAALSLFRPRRPRAHANYIMVFTLFWELCGRPTSNNIHHRCRPPDGPLVIPDDSCQVPLVLARFAGTRGFTLFFWNARLYGGFFTRAFRRLFLERARRYCYRPPSGD